MLHRFLRCQNQTEHIGIELAMKLTLRHLFERFEVVHAGVIDQDVDLAERFLRLSKKPFDLFFLRDIGLDGDGFSAALTDFVNHAICALLRGSVIHDYRRAFGGEMFGDTGADSF